MALITLRRNLCHLTEFRSHRALAVLKHQPIPSGHRVMKVPLCPWFSVQPGLFKVRFHHACCKKFHSENGNDLHPLDEPGFPPVPDWDGLEHGLTGAEEQVFYRRLSQFTSPQEVLSFISTQQALSDAMAAGAFQRICEMENQGGGPGPPKEILGNSTFQALCVQVGREPSYLSNSSVVAALQALSLLDVGPQRRLLLKLVAECQHRLQRRALDVHSLCAIAESLVKLQGPGCPMLRPIMDELQAENLGNFTPEDIMALYRTLQLCAENVDQHQEFLNKINDFTLSIVATLSPTSISQTLTTLVVLDQTQALPLVIKLGRYAVRHVPHFTDEELDRVLEAFIYFGHSDRFFTKALEQHVAPLCPQLDPRLVSRVMEYCGQKLILSRPILSAVAETFVQQSEKFSPRQIAVLIEPFGKLNYLPPNASALFRKLEDILFTQCDFFPPKALLKLLHSCSLIERHPVNFMAKIFSPYFLQQLQGEEPYLDRLSLAQLTQLFVTSALECPFYKGPRLLPKFRVKSFLTPCCSLETPVDFRLYKSVMAGLIDLLGARCYFASRVLTPFGYTIDVEIKLDEEGFVLPLAVDEDVHTRLALCLDGPKRFCVNSRCLLGREATKQRHLRLLGYQVVQVRPAAGSLPDSRAPRLVGRDAARFGLEQARRSPPS
ncbi:PREDICTED: FAST kinase domain-containing protein 3 [Condylura cristata]|uniref:FAST kinase domain-containing protein 3 n=1 Tax=Condylura cristata TaxID=143302 RepID=UPI000334612C|nr:PREDICTED: FAST kinase domain-containing protein 3 [Condylura cristata]